MPEYDFILDPKTEPDYEPSKDHPESELKKSELKKRIEQLTEEMTKLPRYPPNFTGRDLTFAQFREANVNRCNQVFHPINSWKLHDWAIALIGEFGEAMNILKKIKRVNDGTDPLSNLNTLYPALMEEIADIVTYADLLMASEGYSLEEELVEKFNKVSDKRGSSIKL